MLPIKTHNKTILGKFVNNIFFNNLFKKFLENSLCGINFFLYCTLIASNNNYHQFQLKMLQNYSKSAVAEILWNKMLLKIRQCRGLPETFFKKFT